MFTNGITRQVSLTIIHYIVTFLKDVPMMTNVSWTFNTVIQYMPNVKILMDHTSVFVRKDLKEMDLIAT